MCEIDVVDVVLSERFTACRTSSIAVLNPGLDASPAEHVIALVDHDRLGRVLADAALHDPLVLVQLALQCHVRPLLLQLRQLSLQRQQLHRIQEDRSAGQHADLLFGAALRLFRAGQLGDALLVCAKTRFELRDVRLVRFLQLQ